MVMKPTIAAAVFAATTATTAAVTAVTATNTLSSPPVVDVTLMAPPGSIGSTGKANASLILLAESGLQSSQYAATVTAMQQACADTPFEVALWVGIASTNASTQLPEFRTTEDVDQATLFTRDLLIAQAGLPEDDALLQAQLFGAHGPLVGNLLQNWTVDSSSNSNNASGLVLLGSFLGRAHRDDILDPTTGTPSISFAGTLDGVARFSRAGAEAYYHQQSSVLSNAVVTLQGASHLQYVTGSASPDILARDLAPTAQQTDVVLSIGQNTAAFVASPAVGLASLLGPDASAAANKQLTASGNATAAAVQPLVTAMQLEGSRYLHEPCDSDFPTNPKCNYPQYPDASLVPTPIPKPDPMPTSTCMCGSEWVMREAQAMMANFHSVDPVLTSDEISERQHTAGANDDSTPSVTTSDAFHDVSDVHPFHLPHIWNECPAPPSSTCVLNVTTVTMPIYKDDSLDDGSVTLGATEFRTKLKSRQAMMEAAGYPDQNYNLTDGGNLTICRGINERLVEVVWSTLSSTVQDHFTTFGESLVMIDDVVSGIGVEGPEWIKDSMNYTRVQTSPNRSSIEVQSWTFGITNIDHGKAPYYITAGYHYCKLLSPAWVVDWFHTDGLRQHGSLANVTVVA